MPPAVAVPGPGECEGGPKLPVPLPASAAGAGALPEAGSQQPVGFGWLAAIAALAGLGLLFWTREVFWQGYFRPGYYAPMSMLVTSGLLLAVLWWSRRR